MDRRSRSHLRNVSFDQVRVEDEIGFGQDDNRLSAALPGERDEPLDPTEIGLDRQRDDDQDRVDIGRKQLRLATTRGDRPAGRCASAARLDGRPFVRPEPQTHPVPVPGAAVASSAAAASKRAPHDARTTPPAVKTVTTPVSTRATRPGTSSGWATAENAAVA